MTSLSLVSTPLVSATTITSNADVTAISWGWGIFGLIFWVIIAIALWKVFTKAGYAGWLAIIPIVNIFVLVKVGGLSAWWGLLYFVPIAGLVLHIIVALRVGKAFAQGAVFSIFLLWLFQVIGYLILGFGSATYDKSRIDAA
jgi:TctA family transporter